MYIVYIFSLEISEEVANLTKCRIFHFLDSNVYGYTDAYPDAFQIKIQAT